MIKKIKYISVIFFLLLSVRSFSQESPYATAVLDSNTIVIGKRANMQLEVKTNRNERLFWPNIPEQLMPNVEVVSRSPIDTILDNNQKIYRQTLNITSFDTGFYALPPIRFSYFVGNDTTTHYVQTPSVWLEVATVEIDTTQAFYDIKPLMKAPITFREVLPFVLAGVGLVAIVFVVIYFLKRRKNKKPIFYMLQKPKRPNYEIALEGLENLRHQKLWQAGKVKEYYSELTIILRTYIEEQFGIQAIEMTTNEILLGLKNENINAQAKGKLAGILQTSDLVKFAKFAPQALENDMVMVHAVDFIQETKVEPAPEIIDGNPKMIAGEQNDEPQNVTP